MTDIDVDALVEKAVEHWPFHEIDEEGVAGVRRMVEAILPDITGPLEARIKEEADQAMRQFNKAWERADRIKQLENVIQAALSCDYINTDHDPEWRLSRDAVVRILRGDSAADGFAALEARIAELEAQILNLEYRTVLLTTESHKVIEAGDKLRMLLTEPDDDA